MIVIRAWASEDIERVRLAVISVDAQLKLIHFGRREYADDYPWIRSPAMPFVSGAEEKMEILSEILLLVALADLL